MAVAVNHQLTRNGFLNWRTKVLAGLLLAAYLYGIYRCIFVTGSFGGTLCLTIGLALTLSPIFSNTAAVTFLKVFIEPQDDRYNLKQLIRLFLTGAVKLGLVIGVLLYLAASWKHKNLEHRANAIRNAIAQTDRDIATCDDNVRLAQEMGYGNAQQWREQSARYDAYKQQLEAELSAAELELSTGKVPQAAPAHTPLPQPPYYR